MSNKCGNIIKNKLIFQEFYFMPVITGEVMETLYHLTFTLFKKVEIPDQGRTFISGLNILAFQYFDYEHI
jgi:hypothetical protein